MIKLKSSTKVEVRTSPIHGLGVFAINEIQIGELIEECHLIDLPMFYRDDMKKVTAMFMNDYSFRYPANTELKHISQVIALGNGCMYNHSDNNNAIWIDHPRYKAFQYFAIKNILIGEEICINYGGDVYWENLTNIQKSNDKFI